MFVGAIVHVFLKSINLSTESLCLSMLNLQKLRENALAH